MFKQNHSFEKRVKISKHVLEIFPDRVPVIVEPHPRTIPAPQLRRKKYVVPGDLTLGAFIYEVRKQMTIRPEEAIFFMVNDILVPVNSVMFNVYDRYKEECGFLYFTITTENTFG